MRAVLASLCASLGLCCLPCHSPSHERLAYELEGKTIALVQDLDPLESLMAGTSQHVYCSGVWVGEREIITAAHCTEDEDIGDVFNYSTHEDVTLIDGEPHYATRLAHLVFRDEDRDLALLHTGDATPDHGIASLSTNELRPGQPAFAEGAPAGMGWSYSSGEIAAIRIMSFDDGAPPLAYVQATTPISPGSSGGGLYDENGKLIGITRAYIIRGENLNLFVHRDHIIAFLINAHAGQ